MPYAEIAQPSDGIVQSVVVEMKPLADAESGRELAENPRGELRRAVFAQEAHVEMPVIRRPFRFAVSRGRRPGARQIIKAVPVQTIDASDEQLRGFAKTELLHFFRAKGRDARFRHPHG